MLYARGWSGGGDILFFRFDFGFDDSVVMFVLLCFFCFSIRERFLTPCQSFAIIVVRFFSLFESVTLCILYLLQYIKLLSMRAVHIYVHILLSVLSVK